MLKMLKRYMDWVLAGGSGALLFLIFPPFELWFFAFIALVPILIAVSRSKAKRSFYLGLFCGFIYFVGLINWVIALAPFSHLVLVLLGLMALSGYLCLYVGLFALILKLLIQKPNHLYPFYPFTVAAVWTTLEFIRGWFLTGFPWGSIGYSQIGNLPLIQISSLFGVLGVSYIVVLINSAIAYMIISHYNHYNHYKLRFKLIGALLPFCLLISGVIYGIIALSSLPKSQEPEQKIKIAVVPGNIKQANKWKSEKIQDNFLKYFITTQKAARHQPTMVVWPETAVPVDLIAENSYAQSLRELAHQYNVYLLIGVPHNTNTEGLSESEEMKTYNTVFLLSPNGEVLDMYHKTHLVPFGEYIPFKKYLPKKLVDIIIGVGDFEAGKRHTIFSMASMASMASARFGVGICFESVFPEIFRKFAKNGANLMGILTNDAWFEGTAAPRQHYDMAAFRAIENRLAIFRVANGGISAIIDPYGRTISNQITPENPKDGFLIAEMSFSSNNSKRTLYTRWGDVLPYACLIVTIALLIWRRAKGEGRRAESKTDKG